ncbi:hypothetical protein NKH77_15820 [Streptomyces sp. M19]
MHERYAAVASGDFRAVTYDPASVPVDSAVSVVSYPPGTAARGRAAPRRRRVVPHVRRARARRACGAAPTDAGPHYQSVPDPVQPSVDPGTPTRTTRCGSTSPPTATVTAGPRRTSSGGSARARRARSSSTSTPRTPTAATRGRRRAAGVRGRALRVIT